ncbi:Kinase [Hexamita inflata]|uniref:cyclin-dependent kinase n=1 Tax=Hexamita inflata TaxID=28002 RepID=A0AA86TTG7_9EUKA|nr:CMGC CDK [Hexamita inflata]CAI9961278.1 CMGC CDK [Hexamita inflata]
MTDPLQRYERMQCLGEGTYGIVYKARDTETGQIVALKRIRLDQQDEGIPATAIREIAILKELKHPNIVDLVSVIHTEAKLTLVFEYVDLDLKKYMDKYGRLTPFQVKWFLGQLLQGLSYIHNRRVLHRDLKPQNLLVTDQEKPDLKIADFGLARGAGIPVRSYTHEVVTLWYRCPAVLLGCRKYGASIDIWSVGCIFYEMATGKALFPAKNEKEELLKIFKTFGTPNDATWRDFRSLPQWSDDFPVYPGTPIAELLPEMDEKGRDLFAKMMKLDPEQRISARDCLKHEYFDK